MDLLKDTYLLRQHYNYKVKSDIFGDFKFDDGQRVEDIPKPPRGKDFWANFEMKKNYYSYSRQEAEAFLNSRIKFLLSYCERYSRDALTEKELNKPRPLDFKGPYLPVKQEAEKIKNLQINLNWSPSEKNMSNGKFKSVPFTRKHWDILVNQWKQFQKDYGIYDIRPLIGVRCAIVSEDVYETIHFHFYRLLNKEYNAFILYMNQNLPEITFNQTCWQLDRLCDSYSEGRFEYLAYMPLTGLELRFMDILMEQYPSRGLCPKVTSLLMGTKSSFKCYKIYSDSFTMRTIPFRDGSWSKEENLMLIKNVLEMFPGKTLDHVLKSKVFIPWRKIVQNIKVRHPSAMSSKWLTLKSELHSALHIKTHPSRSIVWTSKHTVKLIENLYNLDVQSTRSINWQEMSKAFPGFIDTDLRNTFHFLLRSRVPWKMRADFEASIEHLYHKVNPVYKLKYEKRRKLRNRADLLFGLDTSSRLRNFFSSEGGDDDEEYALIQPSGECDEAPKEANTTPGRTLDSNKFYVEEESKFWKVMMERANVKVRVLKRRENRCPTRSEVARDETAGPSTAPESREAPDHGSNRNYASPTKSDTETTRSKKKKKKRQLSFGSPIPAKRKKNETLTGVPEP